MSYLSQPRLFFSGRFHADPATINNTPDNYNPNANFPPANGADVGNNIQLYWNPNGSGKFAIDCTVTKVLDADGNPVANSPLLGQPLVSSGSQTLAGAKLVDLDPMQQNVTELWGLALELGGSTPQKLGAFVPTAYSNAWVQVINGQGDYAGSAQYQSVLEIDQAMLDASPLLQELAGTTNAELSQLSVAFVLRAYNASSLNYLINDANLQALNQAGVPSSVTDKLIPVKSYNKGPVGSGTPGQIPTTSYYTKLVNSLITAEESTQYLAQILKTTLLPYKPNTDFDFTWGQVFGVIGNFEAGDAPFFAADRMLTPPSVSTDTASYAAYFAPFTVSASGDRVTLNLGNALPSSKPASAQHSNVAQEQLGQLQLCYFNGAASIANAVLLGEIAYTDESFYLNDAALAQIAIPAEYQAAVKTSPLGIISTSANGQTVMVLLQENADGYFLRANQFVFRMNPGVPTSVDQPRGNSQTVEIYVRQFGSPVANTSLDITLMPSLQAADYTNNTLGTGGSSGLVNMSVPASALSFPPQVTTDANGVARFTLTALDPGSPRGYVDGQIYFLQYGFSDAALRASYVQSPDDIISIQVYSQQPDFSDITWENFVQSTLGQYGKLYPVMGFLDLQDEQSVIANAENIYQYLNKDFEQPALMPVTRDLSASRLTLLNRWLEQYFGPKKSAFAETCE